MRLGDLGSLQIGLTSEGAESVKEFATSMIKGAHIIFRPGKQLAELLKILSYQQVRTRAAAQSGDGSDGGNGDGGSGNGDGGSGDKGDGGSGDGGSDNNGEAPDPAE
ncbi:hypothetical protein BFINE_47510 [Bacteroides finegoldii DSM 17565]|nr:hypothetical protein BFINE_47510 [Bacteroides finegoldii DSM 17565]